MKYAPIGILLLAAIAYFGVNYLAEIQREQAYNEGYAVGAADTREHFARELLQMGDTATTECDSIYRVIIDPNDQETRIARWEKVPIGDAFRGLEHTGSPMDRFCDYTGFIDTVGAADHIMTSVGDSLWPDIIDSVRVATGIEYCAWQDSINRKHGLVQHRVWRYRRWGGKMRAGIRGVDSDEYHAWADSVRVGKGEYSKTKSAKKTID